jgi:hypothetical protein
MDKNMTNVFAGVRQENGLLTPQNAMAAWGLVQLLGKLFYPTEAAVAVEPVAEPVAVPAIAVEPIAEPAIAVGPLLAPEPVFAAPEPAVAAPVPAVAAPVPIFAMQVREPQPAPPAQRMREKVYHMQVASKASSKRARESESERNFNTYERKTLTPEECAKSVEPKGEFHLSEEENMSEECCETLIEARAASFRIDLSKQGIKKKRAEMAIINSQMIILMDELKKLKAQQADAEQIEIIHIWAELLRSKAKRNRRR